MKPLSLTVTGVTKEFNRRLIFRDVSFALQPGRSIAVTGRNGSGKSTLVKIVCGLLSATRGTVTYSMNGSPIEVEAIRNHIGLVSPYLQMYDEFSGLENLEVLSRVRADKEVTSEMIGEALQTVGLWERRKDFVRTYSSGMKQRLKYAFAIVHHPEVLVLDEPTSNLDTEGISMVERCVERQRSSGLLIVATNDAEEVNWCSDRVELGNARK
jgi:heme exporter protein A